MMNDWDYPELYYRVYPKIIQSINEHLGEDYSTGTISEEKAQLIVDDVYAKMCKECPEIAADPSERRGRGRVNSSQRILYGRGRLVRDLISIFLISELLRRSQYGGYRNPSNPYFYPF